MTIDLVAIFGDSNNDVQADEVIALVAQALPDGTLPAPVFDELNHKNASRPLSVSLTSAADAKEKSHQSQLIANPALIIEGTEQWNPYLPGDADGPWGEEFVVGYHIDIRQHSRLSGLCSRRNSDA